MKVKIQVALIVYWHDHHLEGIEVNKLDLETEVDIPETWKKQIAQAVAVTNEQQGFSVKSVSLSIRPSAFS